MYVPLDAATAARGGDSAGCFPTMAACRTGPGRFPRCMHCTTETRAALARRPVAVRPVGSSASRVCRSADSGNGLSRWRAHAEPCSPPDRAAGWRSSASSKRAALVRGGRCRRWSERAAREAFPRSRARPFSNHRASVIASGAACSRAVVLGSLVGEATELVTNSVANFLYGWKDTGESPTKAALRLLVWIWGADFVVRRIGCRSRYADIGVDSVAVGAYPFRWYLPKYL
jgi:hypothetical protein